MDWPYLKLFWLGKDDSTGQHERKRRKDRQKKRGKTIILRSGRGLTLITQLGQLKTGLGGN